MGGRLLSPITEVQMASRNVNDFIFRKWKFSYQFARMKNLKRRVILNFKVIFYETRC